MDSEYRQQTSPLATSPATVQVNQKHQDLGSAGGRELYPDAPPATRRSLHRAAADEARGDAVWVHRVASAAGVDERLARELEEAARQSAPAGNGRPGPGQLLEWASDLSADIGGRERRLLKAAIQRLCAANLGPPDLWQRAEACTPSALRSCALAGRAVLMHRRLEAEFHLERAAAGGSRDGLIVDAVVPGLRASLLVGAGLGGQAVREAAAGLSAAHGDRGLERWLTRLLAEGRCYAEGPRAALLTLIGGGMAPQPPGTETKEHATALALGCYRVMSGEPQEAFEELSALLGQTEPAPQPDIAARAHCWIALAHHLLGDWHEADDHARSAIEAARQPTAHAGASCYALRSLLAAHSGDWAAAEENLLTARAQRAGDSRTGDAALSDDAALCDIAESVLAHARGTLTPTHPALARLASPAAGDAARKYQCLWVALRAETLVESGSGQDAAHALADLGAVAESVPYLRVAHCRLSGRLAERHRDPAAARRHYEAAQELPEECLAVPFQAGLLEHCYGRLLTGLGDTAAGPVWLRRAENRLAEAGAFPYARRCAADLAARPGAVDPAAPALHLTERERAVARLAAAGLTNQQAAAWLYVSTKTVEYHLARIYTKLGINSRRQLARYAEIFATPAVKPGQQGAPGTRGVPADS